MPPIDPLQLLKALSPLLSPEGGIKSVEEVARLSSLMKKFSKKLVSRCVYINVLRASPVERIDEFLKKGGWETIHMWLHESKKSSNYPFLIGLLQLYKLLPMSVERLKENNSAKLIKGLTKSENEDVKMLASQVVDSWVKLVKGDQSDAVVETVPKSDKDGKDIKKKKRKEEKKDDKKDAKKDKTSSSSSSSKDAKEKVKDSKVAAVKKSPEKKDSRERAKFVKEAEKEAKDRSLSGKAPIKPIKVTKLNNKVVVRADELEDVKLPDYIRLPEPSEKVAKPERKSTVKQYQARFRSTGLEEPTSLPGKAGSGAVKKKLVPPLIISKLPIKRFGDGIKKDLLPPIKKLKSPIMPPPKPDPFEKLPTKPTPEGERVPAIPAATATPVVERRPEIERREIKLIAPRPAHVIQESAGFMDALFAAPPNPVRKKKKPVTGSSKPPTTPPSPTISAPKLQFYKDTLESQDDVALAERKESGDRDGDDASMDTGAPSSRDAAELLAQDEEEGERPGKRSLSPVSKDDESNSYGSGADSETTSQTSSTTAPGKRARIKKSVSWAAEATLKQIYYFELDETERVNVNNIKNFGDMKTLERQKERQVVENARRMAGDGMEERRWPPLIPIDLPPPLTEPGCNSLERDIQRAREEVVLQEIFFSKESLPDTPHEPDPETFESEEPKIIPLEDENNPDAVVDYSMMEPPAQVTCLPPALSNLVMSIKGPKAPNLSDYGQNVLTKAYEMAIEMNAMNNEVGPMQNFNHQGMEMPGMNNPNMMGIPPPGFDPMSGAFHHHNNQPPPMDYGGPPPLPPHGGFPPPMGMDGPPRDFFDDGRGMNPHMRPPMMGGRGRPHHQQSRGRPMMRHPGPMRGGNGGGGNPGGGLRGGRGRGNMMMGPNMRGGGQNFRGDNFRGDGGQGFRGGDGSNFRGRGRDQRNFGDRGGRGARIVCHHFMNGHCKYENNCLNIHPHPNKNGPHS